jgi:hypothetical protein
MFPKLIIPCGNEKRERTISLSLTGCTHKNLSVY